MPLLERELGWDMAEEASVHMVSALDPALRWLVIRFSKIYSLTLNSRLQVQGQIA